MTLNKVVVDWNTIGPDGRVRALARHDVFAKGDRVIADDMEGTRCVCIVDDILLVLRPVERFEVEK